MRYLGGKARIRNQIAAYLNMVREEGQPYWEPFVGAGWVLEKITDKGPNYASDICEPLIEMWKALQNGWEPPKTVTEEQYRKAKDGYYDDPLTAFIGFGCSWGGKWFGGYARGAKDRNYAENAYNSVTRKATYMPPTEFFVANFFEVPPPSSNCLIYCDPPYKGTTGYKAAGRWNAGEFWKRVRQLERDGHTVVISEYQAPDDFSNVLQVPTNTDIRTNNGKEHRMEQLFRQGEHGLLQPALL